MAKYKLIYFDAMIRAETARLMFKTAGIQFEDHRIKSEEWPELKKSKYYTYNALLSYRYS